MICQGSLFYEKSSHTPHIFSDNFTNTHPMKLKSVTKQFLFHYLHPTKGEPLAHPNEKKRRGGVEPLLTIEPFSARPKIRQ